MARLSQFESAKLTHDKKVKVKGPAGDDDGAGGWAEHHPGVPVHFAIVRGDKVMTGTGKWDGSGNWEGVSDKAEPSLTAGEAYAFALEVRFWWDSPGGGLNDAGGYSTYAWSQEIELEDG